MNNIRLLISLKFINFVVWYVTPKDVRKRLKASRKAARHSAE